HIEAQLTHKTDNTMPVRCHPLSRTPRMADKLAFYRSFLNLPVCWQLYGKAISLHSLLHVFICLLPRFEAGSVPVHTPYGTLKARASQRAALRVRKSLCCPVYGAPKTASSSALVGKVLFVSSVWS